MSAAETATRPPRILVTGSRDWADHLAVVSALGSAWRHLGFHRLTVLVHGDCPTGADRMAAEVWAAWGMPVEAHPADWDTHGKAAGPIRNQVMVDLGADLCMAFPLGESRGTRNCMRLAARAGIPTREVAPDA